MSDTWQGKRLNDARVLPELDIHYRIHATDTGELLAFGTASGDGGAIDGVARHYAETQQDHPGRRIAIRAYDQPAYTAET